MIGIRQIAYKNILRKKTRSILTMIGIALSTWILVSLLGFNRGYEAALNHDIDAMGYQMLVVARGCPYEAATLMLKGGTGLRYMDDAIAREVMKQQEVKAVTSMLMQAVFDPDRGDSGAITAYLGVDPKTFPAMKEYLQFQQGSWFTDPDALEAVIGYEAAELEQREVGDKLLIPGKDIEITVAGVLKRTGTQDDGTIFLPIGAVQRIFAKEGKLTAIGIQVKKDADIGAFEDRLYRLPDVQVVSLAQVKSTISGLVATAKVMVLSIAIIAVLIAMVGVVNTVLMSVFERFEEIGILKSVGAMPLDIFRIIWLETLILCTAGGIGGIALAASLSRVTDLLIRQALPYPPTGSIVIIGPATALSALLFIIAVGLAGGIYPAWRASRIRPIESIRGTGV
jgi:putative ABC transport system permease protein